MFIHNRRVLVQNRHAMQESGHALQFLCFLLGMVVVMGVDQQEVDTTFIHLLGTFSATTPLNCTMVLRFDVNTITFVSSGILPGCRSYWSGTYWITALDQGIIWLALIGAPPDSTGLLPLPTDDTYTFTVLASDGTNTSAATFLNLAFSSYLNATDSYVVFWTDPSVANPGFNTVMDGVWDANLTDSASGSSYGSVVWSFDKALSYFVRSPNLPASFQNASDFAFFTVLFPNLLPGFGSYFGQVCGLREFPILIDCFARHTFWGVSSSL